MRLDEPGFLWRLTTLCHAALLLSTHQISSAADTPLQVWAVDEGVRIDPLTGKAFEEDSPITPGGIKGDYQAKNQIWDGAAKTVAVAGAANEVLGFQLILDGPGASGINVVASELRGPNGASIGADSLTVFRAFYIYVNQIEDYKWAVFPLRAGWYAEPLVPLSTPGIGAPFAIDGSNFGGAKPDGIKCQTLWVDLWIPKGTPAGDYRGTLTVASSAGKTALNLNLKVFGFEMPEENHSVFELTSYNEFSRRTNREFRDEFFILGHQHRVLLTTTEAHRSNFQPEFTHANGKFNWEGFDKGYGAAIDGSLYKSGPRAGVPLEHFILSFDPRLSRPDKGGEQMGKAWPIPNPTKSGGIEVDFTPEYVREFTALLQDASDHFAQRYPKTKIQVFQTGLDEVGFHTQEAVAFAQLRTIQGYTKIVQDVNRRHNNVVYRLDIGAGFAECRFDLDGDGNPKGPGNVVNALGDGVGLWNINGLRMDLDALAPVLKRGVPIWCYNGYEPRLGPTVTNGEGVGPRTWPWVVWNSNLQGANLWNFLQGYDSKPWEKGGVMEKGNKLAGQALFFYPGADVGAPGKVFASMRLKALRRGMQDYEYFYLLTRKDGKPDRARELSTRAVRGDIKLNLTAAKIKDDEVNEKSGAKLSAGDKRHWSHNPEDYERVRYKIGELLSVE